MTDLSPAALKFLQAYVHGMALRLTVDDNEGVYPDVMGAFAGTEDVAEIGAALKELEDAGIVAGYSEPRGGPCVWITPSGIRRAVAEGFVEPRFAWTLWPHDDLQYEAVLAEMGDHDFDWVAAEEWREAVIDMLDDRTLERAEHHHRLMRYLVFVGPRVIPALADAVAVGASDGRAVKIDVLFSLLDAADDLDRRIQVGHILKWGVGQGLIECDGETFDPFAAVWYTAKGASDLVKLKIIPPDLWMYMHIDGHPASERLRKWQEKRRTVVDAAKAETALLTHQRLSGRH